MEIRRSLAEELKSPEARRDLLVSLDRVGDVRMAFVSAAATTDEVRATLARNAFACFAESADVLMGLAELHSTPDALLDCMYPLGGVAVLLAAFGHCPAARSALDQSSKYLAAARAAVPGSLRVHEDAALLQRDAQIVDQFCGGDGPGGDPGEGTVPASAPVS